MTAKKPTVNPAIAAMEHAASIHPGDAVDYDGALGKIRGVVAKTRYLFDEGGVLLRAFEVRVEGFVEHILTSADALTKVDGMEPPPEFSARVRELRDRVGISVARPAPIPQDAYADTTVPQATDDRDADEPGSVDTWEEH